MFVSYLSIVTFETNTVYNYALPAFYWPFVISSSKFTENKNITQTFYSNYIVTLEECGQANPIMKKS